MALADIGLPIALPQFFPVGGTVVTLIDAENEYSAAVFQASRADTITAIGFRTGTVTNSKSLDVGIMAVDMTTGLPDIAGGWLASGNAYGTQASVANGTVYDVTLGSGVTTAIGTYYAIVIKWTSDADPGTVNINSNGSWKTPWLESGGLQMSSGTCYSVASGVKLTNYAPMFNISYGGSYYPSPVVPVTTGGDTNVSLDADGAIRAAGNIFVAPCGARAVGGCFYGDADQDVEVHLFTEAGVSLASGALDKDCREGTVGTAAFVPFSTPYTLVAGTTYRIVVVATSVTACNGLLKTALASQSSLAQAGFTTNCYYTYRGVASDPPVTGDWTDTTTERSQISIVVDQIDISTGAAGGGSPVIGSPIVRTK